MKKSIILNCIILFLVIIAIIFMFNGIKFMPGESMVLDTSSIQMLKFFTIDSNLLIGTVSLLFLFYEIKVQRNKIKEIPAFLYRLKLMGTTAVSLTFLVVFGYLAPITEYGFYKMIMNSNLFLHLIIPVLSIITFVFFEKNNKLKKKDALYGIIPTFLYAIFYLSNILIHMENGKVDFKYDWFWFVQNGVWTAVIVVPVIFIITYLISLCLLKFNKRGVINE